MSEFNQLNSITLHSVHMLCFKMLERVVCVFQTLPKVFSAGLDIMDMYGKSPEHCGQFWKAVQEMWLKVYASNMVTIAAINVSQNSDLTKYNLYKRLHLKCCIGFTIV